MENITPKKPDIDSYEETIDYDIPDLEDLYRDGFIDIVSEVYLEYKKENNSSLLANLDDKLTVICIAYLSILNFIDENNISEEQLTYFLKPIDDEDLEKVKGILKANCTLFENDFGLQKKTRNNDRMDYAKEIIAISLLFEREEEVVNFMKTVNNPNIKEAIKVYFLENDLNLDNMGIKLITNIYEDVEYFVYRYLFKIYLEYSSGYSKARKKLSKYIPSIDENIVILRNLAKENAIVAVTNCLSDLNKRLYTEKEFYKMRDSRRNNFKIIFELSTTQYEKLKSEGFYNERN